MENKDMLRAIVRADREALARVEDAQRRERLLSGSAAEIYAAAETKAMDTARQEVDTLRARTVEASNARRATLDRESAEALAVLDRTFEAKKTECIERIFRMAVDIS